MENNRSLYSIMLLIALLQGIGLLLLHESIEFETWPASQAHWLYSAYSFVLVGPLTFLLGAETKNLTRLGLGALVIGVFCALLGYYVGAQVIPEYFYSEDALLFPMCFTLALLTFKALMYLQVWSKGEKLSYPLLFSYSWRNLLTLGFGLLFALVSWGVLMLWAGLFSVINIEFFYDLFTERWFYYPVLTMALAFGIILMRKMAVIVDTIRRILQVLLKYLLVVLVFISLIFLASLPFTGLAPLWEDGPGSYLILWMQACILFALNSVYQDDVSQRPYHLWVHRFIYTGLLLLPVYSALVFYGLTLRVEQYGWSVARYWGMVVWAVLALFSFGYVWGIASKRDNWIASLGKINVAMGLVFLLIMAAVNSPVLDFRKMTVDDQVARLSSGEIDVEQLDINYFKENLAKPGYQQIQRWREEYADSHPQFALQLARLYEWESHIDPVLEKQQVLASLMCAPECEMPEGLADVIYDYLLEDPWRLTQGGAMNIRAVDPDQNGITDYLLLIDSNYSPTSWLFVRTDQGWQRLLMNVDGPDGSRKALREGFHKAQLDYRMPRYRQIHIGDWVFEVEVADNQQSAQ